MATTASDTSTASATSSSAPAASSVSTAPPTSTSSTTAPVSSSTEPASSSTTEPISASTSPASSSAASDTASNTASNTSAISATSSSTADTSSSSSAVQTSTTSASSTAVVGVGSSTGTSTSIFVTTDAGGGVVTRTSVITTTNAPTSSAVPTASGVSRASKPFFQNKGAVAGVFSVVGIVVLAIIIALLTNTIRRRRAKKFDREIEEAARDAATARPPDFLDDDDEHDNYYRGAGFSDVSSHGTYAQPPMGVESYGMREMGPPVPAIPAQGGVSGGGGSGPAPGEIFDPSRLYADGAAGAAGIGVARARSMGGGAGAALREGGSPYAAFAGPNPALVPHGHAHEVYSAGSSGASRDLLEAAGIVPGIGAGAGLVRGASQYQRDGGQQGSYAQYETPGLDRSRSLGTGLNQVQPPPQRELDRSKSMGAGLSLSQPTSASTDYYSPQAESYNSHQAPQYQNFGGGAQQQQQKQPSQYSPPAQYQPPNYTQGRNSFAYDEEDAYGGFDNAPPASQSQNGHVQGKKQSVGMPNPYSATGVPPPEFRPEAGRGSESDYEEEEEPRRVLKVANA